MRDVDAIRGTREVPTFSIGRKAGLKVCEELIAASGPASGERRLEMVVDWKLDRWPGGAAHGAQSIVTWARSQDDPEFLTSRRNGAEDDFHFDLTRRLHGIAACMMARRVVDGRTGADVTASVNEFVKRRVQAMNALDIGELRRGQSLSLVCVDHSTMAYLEPLYHTSLDEPEVRGVVDFQDLLERIIPAVSPNYVAELMPLAPDLATVVYELFLNSHIHARRDAAGVRLRRSIRSVSFSERLLWRAEIVEGKSGGAGLAGYLDKVEPLATSQDTVKVLEISVMDSGPGLAARIAGTEIADGMDVNEEYELVRGCFLKNKSSRTRPGYGMGLWRVLNVLRARGGFLRLRTGRLSLERAFDPGDPARRSPLPVGDVWLRDSRDASGDVARLGRAEGTVVTILVPVGLTTG